MKQRRQCRELSPLTMTVDVNLPLARAELLFHFADNIEYPLHIIDSHREAER